MKKILITFILLYTIYSVFAQGAANFGSLCLPEGGLSNMSHFGDFVNTENSSLNNDGQIFYHHDITNDGTMNADQIGTSFLFGNELQTILGDIPVNFDNLSIDNSFGSNTIASILLDNEVNVYGGVSFYDGVVDGETNDKLFIFQDNTYVNVAASDNSHVDGFVRKIGDEAFTFPVGDGGFYRPAGISAPSQETDHFTVRYVFSDIDATAYSSSLTDNTVNVFDTPEYWTIKRTNGSSPVDVTLSWNTDKTTSNDLNQENLVVSSWHNALNRWLNAGGENIMGSFSDGYVTSFEMIGDYAFFTLGNEEGEFIMPQLVTPNGDGYNDYLHLEGIDNYPDNEVLIYNRWGLLVTDIQGYNNTTRLWAGVSNRSSFKGDFNREGLMLKSYEDRGKLPDGTYFYIIKVPEENTQEKAKINTIPTGTMAGWIQLAY